MAPATSMRETPGSASRTVHPCRWSWSQLCLLVAWGHCSQLLHCCNLKSVCEACEQTDMSMELTSPTLSMVTVTRFLNSLCAQEGAIVGKISVPSEMKNKSDSFTWGRSQVMSF